MRDAANGSQFVVRHFSDTWMFYFICEYLSHWIEAAFKCVNDAKTCEVGPMFELSCKGWLPFSQDICIVFIFERSFAPVGLF